MLLNTELKYLKFLFKSGVSDFLQDNPNSRYVLKKENNELNNNIIINDIVDIVSLHDLELFMKNTDICKLKKKLD